MKHPRFIKQILTLTIFAAFLGAVTLFGFFYAEFTGSFLILPSFYLIMLTLMLMNLVTWGLLGMTLWYLAKGEE